MASKKSENLFEKAANANTDAIEGYMKMERDEDGYFKSSRKRGRSKSYLKVPEDGGKITVRLASLINSPVVLYYHDFGVRDPGDRNHKPLSHVNRGYPAVCLRSFGEHCPMCETLKHFEGIRFTKKNDPDEKKAYMASIYRGLIGYDDMDDVANTAKYVFNAINWTEYHRSIKAGDKPGDEEFPKVEAMSLTGNQFKNLIALSQEYGQPVWHVKWGIALEVFRKKIGKGAVPSIVFWPPPSMRNDSDKGDGTFTYSPDNNEWVSSDPAEKESRLTDKFALKTDMQMMNGWIGNPDMDMHEAALEVHKTFDFQNEPDEYRIFADQIRKFFSGYEGGPDGSRTHGERRRGEADRDEAESEGAGETEPEDVGDETEEPDDAGSSRRKDAPEARGRGGKSSRTEETVPEEDGDDGGGKKEKTDKSSKSDKSDKKDEKEKDDEKGSAADRWDDNEW